MSKPKKTKKPQVSVGLDPGLYEAVEDYRNRQPIPPSRSRALEMLIRLGIQVADPQLGLDLKQPPPPSPLKG
jgi:hypothetical protein